MPQILPGIDEIAREKNRDVLLVTFNDPRAGLPRKQTGWDRLPRRLALIRWLDEHAIPWAPCFSVVGSGWIVAPYLGEIYVNVIWDAKDATYCLLREHLEDENEQPRIKGVHLCAFTLDRARDMKPLADDEW